MRPTTVAEGTLDGGRLTVAPSDAASGAFEWRLSDWRVDVLRLVAAGYVQQDLVGAMQVLVVALVAGSAHTECTRSCHHCAGCMGLQTLVSLAVLSLPTGSSTHHPLSPWHQHVMVLTQFNCPYSQCGNRSVQAYSQQW